MQSIPRQKSWALPRVAGSFIRRSSRDRDALEETPAPDAIAKKLGERVTVSGWVHDVRLLGGISFILLRNSEGTVQVTVPKKAVSKEVIDQVVALHQEDVIRCTGVV